jgi:hypothetical protein
MPRRGQGNEIGATIVTTATISCECSVEVSEVGERENGTQYEEVNLPGRRTCPTASPTPLHFASYCTCSLVWHTQSRAGQRWVAHTSQQYNRYAAAAAAGWGVEGTRTAVVGKARHGEGMLTWHGGG